MAGRHPPWGLSTADSRLQVWGTGLPFGAVRDASTQPKLCEDSFTNTFYRVILVLRRLHRVGRQESAQMTRQYVSYSDPTNSIPIVLLGSMASSGGIRMDLMAGSIWASGWLRCCGWYPVWWDAGENEVILRVAGRHPPWGLSTTDSRLRV